MILIFVLNSDLTFQNNELDLLYNTKISKKENYDLVLDIPEYKYKRIIYSGNMEEVLNSNNLYKYNNGSNINDEYYNLVIAGHNSSKVFSIIYKLNYNDYLYLNDKKYIIKEKKFINIYETEVLNNSLNRKIITLITCSTNNQKRLIIIAENNDT